MMANKCLLALSWDGTMTLIDINIEDLLPGETIRDRFGQQLLQSRPRECRRLIDSLNFISKEVSGQDWIHTNHAELWLRDHLGQAVEKAMEQHVLMTNPWQTVLEHQVRRIYGLTTGRKEKAESKINE